MNKLLMFLLLILVSCESAIEAPPPKKTLPTEMDRRILLDFTLTEKDIVDFVRPYMPNVKKKDLEAWEEDKSLEFLMINGEKRYYKWAHKNLFRIDPVCKKLWSKTQEEEEGKKNAELVKHAAGVIKSAQTSDSPYVTPQRFRIKYRISVNPNRVPQGEEIRCWIPFPREMPGKQTDIKLLRTDPEGGVVADNSALQRTVFLKRPSVLGKRTEFSVEYEFTCYGAYFNVVPDKVVSPKMDMSAYLCEASPHIVFTEELKALNQSIVGIETNPYRIARKCFYWVHKNIPWTSTREYSTIPSLSQYALENRHGDCGIQTMLLITLLRMNGIPAVWRSGWRFMPLKDTMHDWCAAYFEPYGWVPMDVTRGPLKHKDNKIKWFYLNGIDPFRLVFNEDFSTPLQPKKLYMRSETVDSQRGEVEWNGGNLYFNQWAWDMDWEILD